MLDRDKVVTSYNFDACSGQAVTVTVSFDSSCFGHKFLVNFSDLTVLTLSSVPIAVLPR